MSAGGTAFGSGPTKYDDVDFHDGDAIEAGQPRENAFAHIGFYLAWLIRHDLHDPTFLPPDHVVAVKRGEMTGSDIADDCDWKLLSDLMTIEGTAFSDASYDAYLHRYEALFDGEPAYGVVDNATNYASVEPIIDRLYADWVAAGRPDPEPRARSQAEIEFDAMLQASSIDLTDLSGLPLGNGPAEIDFAAVGSFTIGDIELPHADPDLEVLVPTEIAGMPLEISSSSASDWGSSLLNRALKDLGVRPRDATVAAGMGGSGERFLSLNAFRVPGASSQRLEQAFANVIHRPSKSPWATRRIGDTDVQWAEGVDPGSDELYAVAYWTRDGLVFRFAGQREDVEAAITQIS